MKQLFPGIIISLVLTLSAFSEPVEIGMPEARLLEMKGKPEWGGASGKTATYSWPDMRVSLTDGKVDRVELRDAQKEKKTAADKKSREMAKDRFVEIVETLPDGSVIIEFLKAVAPEPAPTTRGDKIYSKGEVIGYSPHSANGARATRYEASGERGLLIGLGKYSVGDRLSISASPAGNQKHELKSYPKFTVYRATRM